jgi:thiopeptide-type bacteriocin biosynthesis protein
MGDPSQPATSPACDFFVLRTPLLPFDELLEWGDGMEAASARDDPSRLEVALNADGARLRERLRAVYSRPEVREALFVASPDLEGRFDLWLREPEGEAGQKIERALVRYFARMAGRATPFGLFAGCSVGTVADATRLAVAERAQYQRHTRLDMDYLVLLTDALAREPALRRRLLFAVNSTLHPSRGRYRYCEVRRNGKGWTHHQVALEATDYLDATLARARTGARPEGIQAALLEVDPDASGEEAEEYLGALIDNQVLESELQPTVTGSEPIHGLVSRLRARGATDAAGRLEQVRQELEAIDAGGLGAEPARYRRLAELLETLPGEVHLGRLFQVDMVKPAAAANLGRAVLDEIHRGVQLLHRLARPPRVDDLSRFREAFERRYEGREVPLWEALDEETGIGFSTLNGGQTDAFALLDSLTFPKIEDKAVAWGPREVFLLRKLGEALAAGAMAIVLQPRDLKELTAAKPAPLPDSFAVMATVAATSEEDLARGDFQVLLDGVTGPPSTRLLGRFCHADPELHAHVARHVRAEEALRPDAAFAEIVHFPEGRLGNVLARPNLRSYEIPYLGRADVPEERQIRMTDLSVTVAGGEVVLRSALLGRRVIPRLTSAHNFTGSQGIYRFLCALQSQGTASELAWDWGPLRDAPFLPRVVAGRLVLSRASWRVTQEELNPLGQARGARRFLAVGRWRVSRRLPRWLVLGDGDNELPIDLDNVLAVETLLELIKGWEHVTLIELFPGPDQLPAHGPEGRFVHELVVPFLRAEVEAGGELPAQPMQQASRPAPPEVPRAFPPGSAWLYAKLYAGPATLDLILRDVVAPAVARVEKTSAADRWFFVRYGDPDWHLRLRFHGEPARLCEELLPALQDALARLLADGRAWRIQLDTYEREVERYGGPVGIVLAERLFQADSEAALALAGVLAGDARGDVRWRLCLYGMHLLLADLGFNLDQRRSVLRKTRDSFATEFRVDAKLKHQLGTRFRQERRRLEPLLVGDPAGDDQLALGLEVLRRRSERSAPALAEWKAAVSAGELSLSPADLAPSYLHMHANRLLRSAQRAQEMVLYDFLARLYDSQAARAQELRRARDRGIEEPRESRVC